MAVGRILKTAALKEFYNKKMYGRSTGTKNAAVITRWP